MQNRILRREKSIVFVTRRSILRKNNIKKISFVFALVLVLSMVLPMAAFAAGHIHNYIVTETSFRREWYNNENHAKVETHKHECACGAVFYESHIVSYSPHSPLPGSAVNMGSYIGPDGSTVTVYKYTCKICQGSYTKEV